MDSTTTSAPPVALSDSILQMLEQAPQPLTFFQIQRSLPRSEQERTDEIRQCLHDLASQGRIHEFPPYRGKSPRYWTRDVGHYARVAIVEILNERAATQRELMLRLRRRVQGLPDAHLRELLSQMLLEGQLRKLPPRPGGRANMLSARAPEPREYLRPVFRALTRALGEVYKRLESEGVSREQFQQEAEALWRDLPWDQLTIEPEPRRRAAKPQEPPGEPSAAAMPSAENKPAEAMTPAP